jgi:hypothetical protein
VIATLLAVVLVLIAGGSLPVAAVAPAPVPAAAPAKGPYEPAADCARCHESIHRYWSEGPHSKSAASPAFLKALEALSPAGAGTPAARAAREACVWCHAPTVLATGDYALAQPITREGVTCDFCHTVADVRMEQEGNPFVIDPGPIKRGPFTYTESPWHDTAYSSLHKAGPLLCAACHEHRNANGVPVMASWSEWKAGPYPARGVSCQDCHMALVPGTTAEKAVGGQSQRLVNLHRVVGGSSRGQLSRGLDLTIDAVNRSGGSASVQVTLKNVAAGHPIPGGLSSKSLVLAVGVETPSDDFARRQERVYRRELRDAGGRTLTAAADLFLRAASVGKDNRIKPNEARTERFSLPVPEGARAVVARLEYRDASDPAVPPVTTLITEIRRNLASR